MSDLPWTTGDTAANYGAPKPRCRRHDWASVFDDGSIGCLRCGKPRDSAAAARGRRNRNRGNAYERDVARRLGLRRTGQYGGPDDVRGDWLVLQCKNGTGFPERIWGWLNAISVTGDQLRGVVLSDAPGPGHPRREVIVLDLRDFIAWYGKR